MVHILENSKKILLSHILPIISLFGLSQTIHSPLFSQTVNSIILNHMYPAINTPSYPLPLHTLSQGKSPPPRSCTALPTIILVSHRIQSTLLVSTSTPPPVISQHQMTLSPLKTLPIHISPFWPLYWIFVDILVGLYVCLFMLHSYRSVHVISWKLVLQVYTRRWS
jgi:hypothetical protein